MLLAAQPYMQFKMFQKLYLMLVLTLLPPFLLLFAEGQEFGG